MARALRCSIPGVAQHVIQRGNNRCATFSSPQDHRYYLACVRNGCLKFDCRVHAYVMMTNHIHLLVTPTTDDGVSKLLQHIGRKYVSYYNRVHERTGGLWEGRFKSSLIDSEEYLFTCMRYIELNPVRAGLVADPGGYAWSSFRANALGRGDPVVVPHELYLQMGSDPDTRRRNYVLMFEEQIPDRILERIRRAGMRGWALGGQRFLKQVHHAVVEKRRRSEKGSDQSV